MELNTIYNGWLDSESMQGLPDRASGPHRSP